MNDNGEGKLQSVAQQPYAVILDASSTQSLTSLGGLAQAGTSISVEPHISDANYLQLSYSIELSNFTGTSTSGLPPPSQKNSVDSEVTIPDGYTIVVGGLTSKNFSRTESTIPILGDIPILKYAFGTRTWNTADSTLFVFIRPVILRDDQFDDLKFISEQDVKAAGLVSDLPTSGPDFDEVTRPATKPHVDSTGTAPRSSHRSFGIGWPRRVAARRCDSTTSVDHRSGSWTG